jgi:hypothetical protein
MLDGEEVGVPSKCSRMEVGGKNSVDTEFRVWKCAYLQTQVFDGLVTSLVHLSDRQETRNPHVIGR